MYDYPIQPRQELLYNIRTKTVLVLSSLVVPFISDSISDMATRSDIGYTDLWVR
jgi:hypothetical protein